MTTPTDHAVCRQEALMTDWSCGVARTEVQVLSGRVPVILQKVPEATWKARETR